MMYNNGIWQVKNNLLVAANLLQYSSSQSLVSSISEI